LGDRNIVEESGLKNLGGLRPDLYGNPTVSIAGFSGRGENGLNQGSVENIISFLDKFTINKGSHNLRAGNFGYELPIGPGKRGLAGNGVAGKLLEGWQVQGIVSLATGFPFTPVANVVHGTGSFVPQFADRIEDGNLPGDQRTVERWFDTTAFRRPAVGTFGSSGRNVLIGPGITNLDFALQKNTRLAETVTLQFRAESFNIFNKAQFFEPVANVDSPTFGIITSAADPRRIQFGLKLLC
jgi:hypothetical protein